MTFEISDERGKNEGKMKRCRQGLGGEQCHVLAKCRRFAAEACSKMQQDRSSSFIRQLVGTRNTSIRLWNDAPFVKLQIPSMPIPHHQRVFGPLDLQLVK